MKWHVQESVVGYIEIKPQRAEQLMSMHRVACIAAHGPAPLLPTLGT
jgi:hypothetical protein